MKKLILFISFIFLIGFAYCQRTTDTNKLIVRDSAIFNNETLKITGASNEQYLKRISGRWVNAPLHVYSDITMIGTGSPTDPLKVDTTLTIATIFRVNSIADTNRLDVWINNEETIVNTPLINFTSDETLDITNPNPYGVKIVVDTTFLKSVLTCSQTVQTLSGSTDTLNVANGVNGYLDISGNTTIRIEPTAKCNTGNITVLCEAAADSITFTGGTMKISPYLGLANGKVPVTNGANAIDCYSWFWDGVRIIINGTKGYE